MAAKRKVWNFQAQKDKQEVLVAELRTKMIAAHQRIAELDAAQAVDLAYVQTRQPPAAEGSKPSASTSSSSASPSSLPGAKEGM